MKIALRAFWNNVKQATLAFRRYLNKTKTTLSTKLEPTQKVVLFNEEEIKNKGLGFRHGEKEFVHHTELKHHQTAYWSVYPNQKLWMLGIVFVLGLGLAIFTHFVLVALIALLTFLYFADLLFNFFLIWRSHAKSPEIKVRKSEIDAVSEDEWPTYTIFCPLYKEWAVVPQFLEAMDQLDYPKTKLQVMLLLEEDDVETIAKVTEQSLPQYVDVVVVPHSSPKTKPKAMNYGLAHATGEFLVIYDAEDVPEVSQLKKAVLAFKKSDPKIVCVQAKLNFYNPRQNFLTKLFTAEYSLWFDLVLTGLQTLNGPIPLGGTSNHFRVEHLKELKGWDAFNVTEDADLGLRLFKLGYRTAIIDSTTYEEANSDLLNWYRQRSRWIKGYIQTYFVHMRDPKALHVSWKEPHFLTFQLVMGGKILSMFINPLMWTITAIYFLFRAQAGPVIESFFPAIVLYTGVFAFVFGNFLYLYYYMIGLAKRGHYDLIKYAFLVPFYWVGISFAAWKAVYEIIRKPHYWQKTVHGLHLPSAQKAKEPKISIKVKLAGLRNHPAAGGVMFVGASMVANFVNFVFSIFLGRTLSLEDFGTLTLVNTLFGLAAIVFGSLTSTMNFQVAFMAGEGKENQVKTFRKKTVRNWLLISLVSAIAFVAATPFLSDFFTVDSWLLLASFTPIIITGVLSSIYNGQLRGQFVFNLLARVLVIESVVKLIAAGVFVYSGLTEWVALSLPVSLVFAFVLGWGYVRSNEKVHANEAAEEQAAVGFPNKYFGATVLSALASAAFLNIDVLLAKHYLPAEQAGAYALLSLAGKMVFFFGSLLAPFITSIVSRHEGAATDSRKDFYRLFKGTLIFTFLAFLGVGVLGKYTIPLLFGNNFEIIAQYLLPYAAAMGLFTVANTVVSYYLAKRKYSIAWISVSSAALIAVVLIWKHNSIQNFTTIMLAVSAVNFVAVFVGHAVVKNARFVLRNITDVLDVFFTTTPLAKIGAGKKRILVFNWRDTKHVFAGGAEVYIHELAKRWVSAGNQVTLFCGNDGQSSRNDLIDGVQIIRRGGFYFVYLWAILYYFVQFRGKFDVIIDSQNGIPFFTPLYAKEKVYCLMHHVHQDVFRKYLIKPLAMLASFLERTAMPWAYSKTKFITVSDSSHSEMKVAGLGLAGIHIVHPGVDLENYAPGTKDKQPLVMYLGRLKAYKSVDVLIQAFKIVKDKIPNAKLVIVGSGEEESALKKLAATVGFDRDIAYFAGKISDAEKISWLQRAWVLVNPSMMEGWGITSIEANACGVPVVASNVPGLRDSVKNPHTGYLVTHGDVETFAARIIRLLENKSIRDFMAKESIEWANQFDWEKSAAKSLSIIRGD